MRLIIEYRVGDGYTYYATNTVPVIYESAEGFAVDFEKFCKYYHPVVTNFAGQQWDTTEFILKDGYYAPPHIMTVDEFFEQVENETK